jgi:hypothetical protein
MEILEAEYPDVTFIYMTDAADRSGDENRYARNEQVREYCQTHNKVLFDFGEMETWSSGGDIQNSSGGVPYWHDDWSTGESSDYGHINQAGTVMKAKAMWWLFARLAGWNNVNDPPVISQIEPQVFNEDDSLTYSLGELMEYVDDPDHPDSLLLFLPSPGKNVTVSVVADTLVVFSAPENWSGYDTLSVIVSDGELSDTTLIFFEVRPVNDVPFFVGLPDTVEIYLMEEKEINIGDFADDYDLEIPGDSLRWAVSVSDDTLKYVFDPETKDLTLTAPDYADVFTVTITVTDDSGATAEGSFFVNVTHDPALAIENLEVGIPSSYVLKQNYPNPFNPSTHIKFGLPQAGDVLVEIYNLLGQKIITLFDGYKAAGYHIVEFDASNLPTGMYFYRIQADKFNSVKKMMLIK